jgi:hypothetical protein
LGWENERGTKNSFSRREIGFVVRCGAEGKEEPGKVRNPVRSGTAGSEGGFEGSVHSFNEAIGLGMKSCGVNVGNVKDEGKRVPDGGSELGSAVGSDGVRNAKTGDPGGNEGLCTGFGGSGGKRNSF